MALTRLCAQQSHVDTFCSSWLHVSCTSSARAFLASQNTTFLPSATADASAAGPMLGSDACLAVSNRSWHTGWVFWACSVLGSDAGINGISSLHTSPSLYKLHVDDYFFQISYQECSWCILLHPWWPWVKDMKSATSISDLCTRNLGWSSSLD